MIYLIIATYLLIGFIITSYHTIYPYFYNDLSTTIISNGFEFILFVLAWSVFPIAYFSIRLENKKRY